MCFISPPANWCLFDGHVSCFEPKSHFHAFEFVFLQHGHGVFYAAQKAAACAGHWPVKFQQAGAQQMRRFAFWGVFPSFFPFFMFFCFFPMFLFFIFFSGRDGSVLFAQAAREACRLYSSPFSTLSLWTNAKINRPISPLEEKKLSNLNKKSRQQKNFSQKSGSRPVPLGACY